jgi:hypothetical protein
MSKEIQIETAQKIKDNYNCKVIINNDNEPYCLICLSDISKLLGFKHSGGRTILNKFKVSVKNQTAGGEQKMIFLTYNGLHSFLSKSRKPSVIDFCKKINIDIFTRIYSCVEADTLKCITEAFSNEEIIYQHRIASLYFEGESNPSVAG